MTLIKLTPHLVDARGKVGGVYYTRDKSGLHCSAFPRHIKRRTKAQDKQRKAFSMARNFSTIPRTVSYNIYRALNDLDMKEPPIDYPAKPPTM